MTYQFELQNLIPILSEWCIFFARVPIFKSILNFARSNTDLDLQTLDIPSDKSNSFDL